MKFWPQGYLGIRWFAQYNGCCQRFDFHMMQDRAVATEGGSILQMHYATVEWKERSREDFGQSMDPTLKLSDTEAQDLIDVLWNAGLRPSGIENVDPMVGAQKRHIHDLRAVLNSCDALNYEGIPE